MNSYDIVVVGGGMVGGGGNVGGSGGGGGGARVGLDVTGAKQCKELPLGEQKSGK